MLRRAAAKQPLPAKPRRQWCSRVQACAAGWLPHCLLLLTLPRALLRHALLGWAAIAHRAMPQGASAWRPCLLLLSCWLGRGALASTQGSPPPPSPWPRWSSSSQPWLDLESRPGLMRLLRQQSKLRQAKRGSAPCAPSRVEGLGCAHDPRQLCLCPSKGECLGSPAGSPITISSTWARAVACGGRARKSKHKAVAAVAHSLRFALLWGLHMAALPCLSGESREGFSKAAPGAQTPGLPLAH